MKTFGWLSLGAAVLLAMGPARARAGTPIPPGPTPSDGAGEPSSEGDMDAMVLSFMQSENIPGFSVAVSRDGKIIYGKGFGYSNLAVNRPLRQDSRLRIGSASKVLVAASMMKVLQTTGHSLGSKVYGASGILDHSMYRAARLQGVRRHRPVIDLAIGSNNRVTAWYSDRTYSIGRSDDLDRYQSRTNFTLPPGKSVEDIVGIARAGQSGRVYTWYADGSRSIGTAASLGSIAVIQSDGFGAARSRNTLVGIGMRNSDYRVYAWYHDGTVSAGTFSDISRFWVNSYTTAPSANPYDIVGVAVSDNQNKVAFYSDDRATKGTSTDLDAVSAPYAVSRPGIPGSRADVLGWFEDVEIRHLLSHSSGLTRSGERAQALIAYPEAWDPDDYTPSNLYVLATRPWLFEPGTDESYSNHGFGLLGFLIEEITGQSWYTYMRTRLLEPLGLGHVIPYSLSYSNYRDSRQYERDGSDFDAVPTGANHTIGSAAGALKGSATDIIKVLLAIDGLSNHPEFLPSSLRAAMETRPFPGDSNYGLGWDVQCKGSCSSDNAYHHNGVVTGGSARIVRYDGIDYADTPALEDVNVVLIANTNVSSSDLDDLARQLATRAMAITGTFGDLYDSLP